MGEARFEGHSDRECGEHRTLGGRAWCFDCSAYCYPDAPCPGCELPALRSRLHRVAEVEQGEGKRLYDCRFNNARYASPCDECEDFRACEVEQGEQG